MPNTRAQSQKTLSKFAGELFACVTPAQLSGSTVAYIVCIYTYTHARQTFSAESVGYHVRNVHACICGPCSNTANEWQTFHISSDPMRTIYCAAYWSTYIAYLYRIYNVDTPRTCVCVWLWSVLCVRCVAIAIHPFDVRTHILSFFLYAEQ